MCYKGISTSKNNKTGYRKFDLWFADLSGIMDCNGKPMKNRNVIIMSNYINNSKASTVNCCTITSQYRKCPSHIKLDGFGLDKVSYIRCENIYTVEKSKLLCKIGYINDLFTQINIDKKMDSQLQLGQLDFSKTTMNEFEVLLNKGVNNMRDYNDFNSIKSQIVSNGYDKILDTIELCDKIINNKYDKNDKKYKFDCLFYAYYHKALMYKQMKDYDKALLNIKLALSNIGEIKPELNDNYTYAMWCLASIYESTEEIDKSINIYKNLSVYYNSIGKYNTRLTIIFNIAKLRKNINTMKNLMILFKNSKYVEYSIQFDKEDILKQMQNDIDNLLA